ncbi:MAG: hypothetical protein HKO08_07510 [Erythrobacter sp.]|nr:hypothetical protein [Erythrobacter sp.]
MTIERRPDGTLVFHMHVPLWTSLLVMVLFFAFGILFAYGLFFEDTSGVRYRGVDLGFSLEPWVWKLLFFLGTLGMLAPGVFLLLGFLRGGKPHVRLDERKLTVGGRAMASDVSLRWDDIAAITRFRIQHLPAVRLKAKAGKNIQLSAHTFPEKGEFERLCREIEARAGRFGGLES